MGVTSTTYSRRPLLALHEDLTASVDVTVQTMRAQVALAQGTIQNAVSLGDALIDTGRFEAAKKIFQVADAEMDSVQRFLDSMTGVIERLRRELATAKKSRSAA